MEDAASTLEFAAPGRLWLFAAALPLALIAWRSRLPIAPWRRRLAAFCRLFALGLAIFAFSGPALRQAHPRMFVALVVDRSESVAGKGRDQADTFVRQALASRGEHQAVVLPFAGRLGEPAEAADSESGGLDPLQSDPSAAIAAAAALAPEEAELRIVLLSDGNATRGDLLKTVEDLGVPVWTVPLPAYSLPEAAIIGLSASAASSHAPLSVRVEVAANHENEGRPAVIELLCNGHVVGQREVTLRRGVVDIELTCPRDTQERFALQATLRGAQDTHPENNRRTALVLVEPPPRALVVAPDAAAGEALSRSLRQAGFAVERRLPGQAPRALNELASLDLVALVDCPAPALSAAQAQALAGAVEAGAGLLVVGGDEVFAQPSLAGAWLQARLPVAAAEASVAAAHEPIVAVTLALDQSQSMKDQRKMDLAKEAAKEALKLLSDRDLAGVLAFSDSTQWIRSLGPCVRRDELFERIDEVVPLYRTNLYLALERAYLALRFCPAESRHVVVVTDSAGDALPDDFAGLARQMRQSGIVVSTIAVGAEADDLLPQALAEATGGRVHLRVSAASIPQLLVQETREIVAAKEATRPMVLRMPPEAAALSPPPLRRHAVTRGKRQAELWMVSESGDPLVAWWRSGEGAVMAICAAGADLLESGWLGAAGEFPLWRLAAPRLQRPRATPPGRLKEVQEGHDYPDELRWLETNERLLRQVAEASGGRFAPSPADLWDAAGARGSQRMPLWPGLVTTALVFFLADVTLRRGGLSHE